MTDTAKPRREMDACRALYPPQWAAPLNLGTVLCDQPAGHTGQHLGHSPGKWDVVRVFWDQNKGGAA